MIFSFDLKMPTENEHLRDSVFISAQYSICCCHFGCYFGGQFPYFQRICITVLFILFVYFMCRNEAVDQMKYKPKWHWAICMFRANFWMRNGTPRSYWRKRRDGQRDCQCNKNRRLLSIIVTCIIAMHCIMISILWFSFFFFALIFGLFGKLPQNFLVKAAS